MKSTVENLSPTRVRLAVEVPFDELKPSLDAAYKKIGVADPRPGLPPGQGARAHHRPAGRPRRRPRGGRQRGRPAHATSRPRASTSSRRSASPRSRSPRSTTTTSLSFTAEVDVRPEITLPELDGIAVTVDDVEVTDDDVDEQLDALRERFGTLKGVDRPVADRRLRLDRPRRVDRRRPRSRRGSANGMSYEVGTGDLIDGLDDAIIGTTAGDTVDLHRHAAAGRARRRARPRSRRPSTRSRRRNCPSSTTTSPSWPASSTRSTSCATTCASGSARVKKLEQGAQARDKLVEQLVETVEFPVPESAVQAEVDYREHEIVHSLGHDDALFDQYLAGAGQDARGVHRRAARGRREVGARAVRPRRDRRHGRGAGRRRRAHRVPRAAGRALRHGAAGVRQPGRAGGQPAGAGRRRAPQQGARRRARARRRSPTRRATRSTCRRWRPTPIADAAEAADEPTTRWPTTSADMRAATE